MIPDISSLYPTIFRYTESVVFQDTVEELNFQICRYLNYIRGMPDNYEKFMKKRKYSEQQLILGNICLIGRKGEILEMDTAILPFLYYIIDLTTGDKYYIIKRTVFCDIDVQKFNLNIRKCIIISINDADDPIKMIEDLNEYNFKRGKYRKQYATWQDYVKERMDF